MSLTTNLVSYFKCDNANDSVGSNNATTSGVSYVSGLIGNAAQANGGRFYNNSCSWGTGKSGSTVAGWFNIAGINGGGVNQIFNVDWTDYGVRIFIHIYLSNDLYFDGLGWSYQSSTVPSTSTWYHVALTSDGTNARIYLNGSKISTQTISGTVSNTSLYTFMEDVGGVNSSMNGKIDEIGIWTRMLSDSEITQLYNGGAGLQYPFVTTNSNFLAFM